MNIFAITIIVAYNSDIERLSISLALLSKQCLVIVVDNSDLASASENIRSLCELNKVKYFSLGGNYGIAKALNVGIEAAKLSGATDVLLMDDDSIPTHSLIVDLLKARDASRIYPVVVSARIINANGEDISNCTPSGVDDLTSCGELNSSGSLIPMSIFDMVGKFDEKLFIDCVDFEWGWRARAMGVSLVLCDQVTIQHQLGEGARFGFKITSPARHYYQFRNVLHMIFNSSAPLQWRISQLFKLPLKILLIPFLTDRSWLRLRYAFCGLVDFVLGRFGKLDRNFD